MLPLSRCPSFFLGVQVFKVLGHSRDVCGECGEKRSAHKPPVKRSGATRQGGVRDTKSTREKTSAGISPFLKFETSPLLRKKLQTGNIKTQVKRRGKVGVGWGVDEQGLPHTGTELIALGPASIRGYRAFVYVEVLGNFSAWVHGDGPGAASPAPVTQPRHPSAQGRFPRPGTLERASLTGLPGAARQQNQLVSTTAQNCLKRKRKKKSHKQTKKGVE